MIGKPVAGQVSKIEGSTSEVSCPGLIKFCILGPPDRLIRHFVIDRAVKEKYFTVRLLKQESCQRQFVVIIKICSDKGVSEGGVGGSKAHQCFKCCVCNKLYLVENLSICQVFDSRQ